MFYKQAIELNDGRTICVTLYHFGTLDTTTLMWNCSTDIKLNIHMYFIPTGSCWQPDPPSPFIIML